MKNSENGRFCQLPKCFFENHIAKATKTCYHCVKRRFGKKVRNADLGSAIFLGHRRFFLHFLCVFSAQENASVFQKIEKAQQNAN